MSDSLTKVNYKGVKESAEKISEIGENNLEIGQKFKKIINGFNVDKSLSSKVITPSMEKMIDEIDKINIGFKDLSDKFAKLLNEVVVGDYNVTDNKTQSLWEKEEDSKPQFTTLEYKKDADVYTSSEDYIQGTSYSGNTNYDNYTNEEFMQLASIIAGEDNKTYDGALAVASTMCNRADRDGYPSDPLSVAKSPNQFTAYGGENYNKYMSGQLSIPDYVIQATKDALNGTRNTTHVNFRAKDGDGRTQIGDGGNYYFG